VRQWTLTATKFVGPWWLQAQMSEPRHHISRPEQARDDGLSDRRESDETSKLNFFPDVSSFLALSPFENTTPRYRFYTILRLLFLRRTFLTAFYLLQCNNGSTSTRGDRADICLFALLPVRFNHGLRAN
jgi:hypothetical protein